MANWSSAFSPGPDWRSSCGGLNHYDDDDDKDDDDEDDDDNDDHDDDHARHQL